MERLTEKHYSGKGYFMKCSEACANDDEMCGGCPQLDKIIDRLAAYEDTGLTPEETSKLDAHRKAMAALADSYKAEIPHWIPVTERLPEDGLPKDSKKKTLKVLVAIRADNGVYTVRSQTRSKHPYYHPNTWEWGKFTCGTITHWMPLPEAPKGE